jgi:hypothetical protein
VELGQHSTQQHAQLEPHAAAVQPGAGKRLRRGADRQQLCCWGGSHLLPDPSIEQDKATRVAGKFLYYTLKNRLQPTLLVMYEREAYLHPLAPYQRATVDTNVRFYSYPSLDDLFHGQGMVFLREPLGILELKFNNFMPVWMRRLEAEFNLRQLSISKYALGIDACREDNRKEVNACQRTYWRLCS